MRPSAGSCREYTWSREGRCYTSPPAVEVGGDGIGEILANAWRRLWRKQLLALYPFALGLFNTLAFLAVYSSLEPSLGLSAFFRANFNRWTYIQEHSLQILTPGVPLAVAAVAAVAVCVLAAAVRAPFFRAVTGTHYPLAPRSLGELLRLMLFYMATYAVFTVLPYSLSPQGIAFAILSWVLIPLSALVMFGDYVLVFEGLTPWRAVARSVALLRKAWRPALATLLLALLLWYLVSLLFDRYYAGTGQIFLLFPLSQLLVEAMVTTVIDVLLISTYDQYRG